jgi:monothiol glutaredoxin
MKKTVSDRIRKDLQGNDVVLYLKGTVAFPMCGFSAAAVQILSQLNIPFKAINVLEDREIRDGVKAYSGWNTIPQLFIKGEFIGGCEIIREMFNNGKLRLLLQEKGLALNEAA